LMKFVNGFEKILKTIEPINLLERYGWLLSTRWPKLPKKEKENDLDQDKQIETAQNNAAREILDTVPLEKIIKFAKEDAEFKGEVGLILGRIVKIGNEENAVLDSLICEELDVIQFEIVNYSRSRINCTNKDWVEKQINRLKKASISNVDVFSLLLLGLPENMETWKRVELYDTEIESAYWRRASGMSRSDRLSEADFAISKLLDVNRPYQALQLAGDHKIALSSKLLKRLVQSILVCDDENEKKQHRAMFTYHLANVFRQLHENNDLNLHELAELEVPFASIFDDLKRNLKSTFAIHRVLQNDPTYFAYLISTIYFTDDGVKSNEENLTEEQLNVRAKNSISILDTFSTLPGLKEDGSIDAEELESWIESANKKCKEIKRTKGFEYQIGKLLANSPIDDDGHWPHIAVRNVIEKISNKRIDLEILIGKRNKRGMTVRSPGDGGAQENDLSLKYAQSSDFLVEKWPKTARIIKRLSDSYQYDAKREDNEDDLRDLMYN
ncbi:MAG: hypothetical protein KJ847_02685, partial [Firmicutes bacterium]|nr:hypothetical protein [Bacillota bacterium]